MTTRIIRVPNSPGREEDGFRVLQEKQEYATYPDDSSFRLWFSDVAWTYESHYHSAVEAVLTLKGSVEYKAGGQSYSVREGDVILVPPDMQHELSMDASSQRYLYLFEPDVLMEMRDFKRQAESFNRVFLLNDQSEVHTRIRDLLLEAAEVYNRHEPMWNTLCNSYVLQIYALLGQKYLSAAQRPRTRAETRMDSESINNTLTYISNHYAQELTLEEVAEFAGFSKFYFSRTFKKQTGYSFKDYLCQKRLQVASDLLIRTRKSMRDIAVESGFGSVTTFNRAFRERRGCTPTEYRIIYGSF